jgi:hypothetical protein
MAYVKNIKIKRATGNCCEDCRCGGSGCPGCPEYVRSFQPTGDIWKSPAFNPIRKIFGKKRVAMGDFDPIQNCVDSHPGDAAGAQSCINVVTGGGGAPASPGGSSSGSSGGSTAGNILGGVLSTLFGPKAPVMYPPGYQSGMSDTTKILLLGGGAVVLVMLLRKRGE